MRSDSADGAFTVGAGDVDGLPWELDVLEQQADAVEPGLYHDRAQKEVETHSQGGLRQTEVSQRILWTKSEMGDLRMLGAAANLARLLGVAWVPTTPSPRGK